MYCITDFTPFVHWWNAMNQSLGKWTVHEKVCLNAPGTNLDPPLIVTHKVRCDAYRWWWCAAGGKWVAAFSERSKVNFSLVFTPIAVRPGDVQTASTILGLWHACMQIIICIYHRFYILNSYSDTVLLATRASFPCSQLHASTTKTKIQRRRTAVEDVS